MYMREMLHELTNMFNKDIDNVIEEWLNESKATFPVMWRLDNSQILISSTNPGVLIGYKGRNAEILRQKIKVKGYKDLEVVFEELPYETRIVNSNNRYNVLTFKFYECLNAIKKWLFSR